MAPTRRRVLAASGVTMGALIAARLSGLGQLTSRPITPSDAAAGPAVATRDWISPLGRPEAQVAHLLRRATFGATAERYQDAVRDGFARTLDSLIETTAAEPPSLAGADEATRSNPIRPLALQQWWISWMLSSPTPFAERMTFFWHGHFTSDYRKVTPQAPFIYWQNLTWRRIALGDLRTMLMQVTIDPAMLRYLDLGQSTGRSPNENYSRELMELFTMGVGTYTEDDVRAGAKALAGWREPLTQAMVDDVIARATQRGGPPRVTPKPDGVRTGVFDPRRSYNGPLTFLGLTKRWTTGDVLDRILEQASVAPFVTTEVLREFVTPDPDPAYVRRLADRFRRSRYDMKTLMRDVFTSPEFLEPTTYRALVKSPLELMVTTARALEVPAVGQAGQVGQIARAIAAAGSGMGQSLFDPPDVGGWPTNASWISSTSVLARVNFAVTTLAGLPKLPPFAPAPVTHLDGVVSPETARLLGSASDEASRWLILLASPEFQLK